MNPPLNADPILANISEDGEAPKTRLTSALAAEQLFWALVEADRRASHSRAAVDAMIDGEPPYDPKKLKELGQAHRCNLNFLEGAAAEEAALTGYVDLVNSVDYVAQIKLDSGDPSMDAEYSRVVSEEFSRLLIKKWPRFHFNYLLLSTLFVRHGVAFAYWEDDRDWRWRVSRIGDFLVPRGTEATEDDLEIAFRRRSYRVHQLYNFIKDPEIAERVGWNVEVVRKAILNATEEDPTIAHRGDWEAFEMKLKANDLHVSLSRGVQVFLCHVWIHEFNGTVSHKIILQKGNTQEFLYERIGRFESIHQAFTAFTYGVGNGELHSIRGLGYKIFPFVQTSNRLRCQAIDGATLASSILVQPKDEEDIENLGITQLGPYSILPPNLNIVTVNLPNVGTQVLPVVRDLGMVMENNTGTYRSRATQPSGQERTKFEVQAELQQEATLSVSAMNLFYTPWERLIEEQYRRVTREDYSEDEPGGREVWEFRRRCLERGVDIEMLQNVESITPVRAIGFGSPQMRVLALDDLRQMAPQMDDVGRYNLLRDSVASRMGYNSVDRYVPPRIGPRPTQEQRNAEFENTALRMGQAQVVFPDDQPLAHLKIHLPALTGLIQAAQMGSAAAALSPLQTFLQHCGQHLQKLEMDPSEDAKAAVGQIKQVLNQAAELVQNIGKQIQQQQQMAAQQDQPAPGPDPKSVAAAQAAQQKLVFAQQSHDQRMQQHADAAKQKMTLKDLESAQKIRNA